MYNVSVFVSFLQSVIGFTFMSSSTMDFKEPIRKRIITGLIVMLSGIIFLSLILFIKGMDSVDNYAVLFILFIQLSWFIICSKDSFFVSLFSFLTFVNIYISISYTSDVLSMNYTGIYFVLLRIIIRLIIYICILPLLFKIVRPRFRSLVNALDKEWRIASIVPLIFLTMQIIVLYYPAPYWHWNEFNWYKYIIITVYLLFVSVYYLLYIQASAIVEKYALEKRQLLMAQQEKLWESEVLRQKATADLVFKQRHDMRHHNGVIIEMLKNGEIEQLKEYMEKFDEFISESINNNYCANPITNGIFNQYALKAEKYGIKVGFNVNIPIEIGIDNIDITCVLGNALENALEACLRLEKNVNKEIIVTLKFKDNRLRIQIENTCNNDIIFDGDLPLTKKKNGGTGIKSILYTAEKYDGTAGFSVIDGRFITQIVLNGR